ncbi:hypothetical protein J6590_081491 [Homalodisca vitripennis]|nr:hypothetical protein J6590_081491 [Homalodisca vitripennis]
MRYRCSFSRICPLQELLLDPGSPNPDVLSVLINEGGKDASVVNLPTIANWKPAEVREHWKSLKRTCRWEDEPIRENTIHSNNTERESTSRQEAAAALNSWLAPSSRAIRSSHTSL